MAIGNQMNANQLNIMLANRVKELQVWIAAVLELQSFVVNQGVSGLENLTTGGFTATDAPQYQIAVNYLNNVAVIANGTAAQATPFDFLDALTSRIGPNPSM